MPTYGWHTTNFSARTATERETKQLNHDMMFLCELQDDLKAVLAFIDKVPTLFNAQNERFRDENNTLNVLYKPNLATTTNMRPSIAPVRH